MFRRSLVLALALAALCAGPLAAGQAAAPPAAGRIVESTVPANALKGNRLGDPAESRVAVYLPPGYDAETAKRFPTLYLLHGYYGSERTFLRILAPALDGLVRDGTMREMIVVIPSGRNAYFGAFYTNSPVTGNWEDFFVKELVAWVDGQYRTIPKAESRGVAGHSMGGYGAIMLAMKHPDVFSALYALSPCCVGLEGDLGPDNPAWIKAAQIASRDQLQPKPTSLDEFFPTVFVALSAALSPAPDKGPMFVTLPFVEQEKRLVPNAEAYAAWRSKMPLYLVERYRTNLLKLRGIYLEYGALEEFSHIRTATQALSEELAERDIGHVFEVYAGGDHSNKVPERLTTRVLPFFSRVLAGH